MHAASCFNFFVSVALAINAPQLQYTGNIGSSITLQCVVTGQATSVIWLKNSVQLNINSNNRLSNGNVNNPSLTISNIQANDEGQYTCRATDGSRTVNTQPITFNTQCKYTLYKFYLKIILKQCSLTLRFKVSNLLLG